jgi:phosphoserine aminotransferase
MTIHNFNPGPAILPRSVLDIASKAIIDYNGSGMSVLEISHRDILFGQIIESAQQLVREIYQLNSDYEILFMQGGASTQFALVPMNFLDQHESAAYIDTGIWSSKAIKEAMLFGNVKVVASSKDKNYSYIPKEISVPDDSRYLHITSNNTVYGSQFHFYPETSVPIVADMSSDIFSREIDAKKFDLIYAGAQKNAGTAGTTLVIIKKDFLKTIRKKIPSIFDYRVWAEHQSLYNTPAVFAVYVCYLTLRWLQEQGGLKVIEARNRAKAALLYEAIDQSNLFTGNVVKEDRSMMNVTFSFNREYIQKIKLSNPRADEIYLEHEFLNFARANGIVGIKGHRLSGGFRASLYNALPIESVRVLIEVMRAFERKYLI